MDTDTLLVELVEALDYDLELLEVLRYRLVVLGALAGADQGSMLLFGVREIEMSYEALRVAEMVRASVTERVADELDIDALPTLEEIADFVSAGWGEVLRERRRQLIEIVTEIQGISRTVGAAMGRRVALAEEARAFLRSDATSSYGRPSLPREGVLVEGAI